MTEPMTPAEITAMVTDLSAIVIMDEVRSNNPLGKNAAKTILALQAQLAAMTEARNAAVARVVTPQEAATVLLDWWNQDAPEAGSIAIEARKVIAVTTALISHEGDPWSQFNAAMKTLAEGTPT